MHHPASVANKRLTAWLNPLDATLTKNRGRGAVMLNQLPLGFGDSTFRRSDPPTFQRTLHLLLSLFEQRVFENPFEIKRFRTLSKNSRVYGIASHSGTRFFHQSPVTGLLRPCRSHLPCYTVPPWLANDSANTSSPIFIGARRSRAPFAFRRIPLSRSRGTINIAGSKLALVTAKCPSISSPQALPSTPSKSIRLSSPACATSQNYSPISPSSPATFSKPTSPPSLPA